MNPTLVVVLIIVAGLAGMFVRGAICYTDRIADDKAYTSRAKAMTEEIVRLKEQEVALRSELARVHRFCKHLWVVDRGPEEGVWLEFIGVNVSVSMESIKMGRGPVTRKNLDKWEDKVIGKSIPL